MTIDIFDRRAAGSNSESARWLQNELDAIKARIEDVSGKVDALDTDVRGGVPEGGFQQHLRFHLDAAKKAQENEDLIRDLKRKGIMAVAVGAVALFWDGLLLKAKALLGL